MKCAELGNPDSPHPVRRRSLRLAMAKEENLPSGGEALSAEDELDEVPLIKRMEKVQVWGRMDNGVCGRFASRYFPSCKLVKRRDITNAFINFDREAPNTMPNDVLKMALIYALANSFLGNQPYVNLPMSYLNLVDDINEFNCYPWGDDVWSELIDHVYRCAVYIEKGGSTRPTFGGYMFALQVWAFETFPSLAEVVVKAVEPTAAEMLVDNVKELFKDEPTALVKGKRKLSLSASKRVRNVREKQVNIRDALGKIKAEGVPSGSEMLPEVKKVDVGSVKGADNLVGHRGKKEGVAARGKLDEILGILRQKAATVDVGSASGKGSLLGGNEEVKVQVAGPSGAGDIDVGVKCGDDLELRFDAGGPSFDLLTQIPKVNTIADDVPNDRSGNVSVAEGSDDAMQEKCLDIPYTETQYDPYVLELSDRETKRQAPPISCELAVVECAADGRCKKSIEGGEPVMKSGDITMPNPVPVPVNVDAAFGVGHAFSTASNSNSACVEIDRPKRVHKSPERYTPSEAEQDRKRRKLERIERARERHTRDVMAVCYGPFSEDSNEMPAVEEVEKVRGFLNEGLLKRHDRGNKTCRYTTKVEDLSKNPIVLDGFTVDSKTWLYELFTNTEWLRSTHVEIAMYFLEVKGRQYDLLQLYTTTTPYFLQGLYKHQERVNVGKARKKEVISNMNLTAEVKGLAQEYSRPWSECDFVHMPLNTGDHWILLVLEVEGRTIRVYDSKGMKGKSCRAFNEYVECITELLPVLLDLLSVYDEHSDGPMGKKKFSINVIDGCPQQNDGSNCGMFMLKFAEFLMMDREISDVHSRDMQAYREKMTTEFIVYSNEQKEQTKDL
ncbi:unnamed protein product [Cuscuta campestris]|uniref:Ubiquitin-like protease family profile domain-containing protein n=1 Tax=Cuscuta campestris TaxID=132261 RepID=A0A484L3Q9_9ASTE|nr:unnamed protein product [Cuscuta campestris]